ncbi:MAG: octanoyltransferase [Anaerolineales bacterium]|nr:octanoyltransferase [Anaerolineales bacterium]
MEKSGKLFPAANWRIIISDPLPGAMNMAVDAAILSAVGRDEVPPTLRLYRWDPPCLSLGYSQPFSDLDQGQLRSRGWDIVRRPTGGRAILHTDELTYAVIGPKTDPRLKGGLMESYRRLSQALSESLKILGLQIQIHSGKNPDSINHPVCFENPSDFEITVEGKKIIGSAQARKKEGILQHGTLPLIGDLTRVIQVLKYSNSDQRDQAAAVLLQKAATVEAVLGREVSWNEAAAAFQTGFQNTLNLHFNQSDLSSSEKEEAQLLVKTQYGDPRWTEQL